MKTVTAIFSLLLISTLAVAQHPVRSDTTIRKTIKVNGSFELQFVHCPGAGYTWDLMKKCDSSAVSIRLLTNEVMSGNAAVGGHYVSTYKYKGLMKGTYLLEYFYRRPWLQEYLYKCSLTITVK
jgi:predicted secreted protein